MRKLTHTKLTLTALPPQEQVQFILGGEKNISKNGSDTDDIPCIFTEMAQLKLEDSETIWKETGRCGAVCLVTCVKIESFLCFFIFLEYFTSYSELQIYHKLFNLDRNLQVFVLIIIR